VALNEDGTCRRLALGIGAITEVPFRLDAAAALLVGRPIEVDTLRRAITEELANIAPMADLHASAEYRGRVAATLAVRAVMDAVAAAKAENGRAR
jgi:CO/xanthine dehydrogenase FAD-binding subunit